MGSPPCCYDGLFYPLDHNARSNRQMEYRIKRYIPQGIFPDNPGNPVIIQVLAVNSPGAMQAVGPVNTVVIFSIGVKGHEDACPLMKKTGINSRHKYAAADNTVGTHPVGKSKGVFLIFRVEGNLCTVNYRLVGGMQGGISGSPGYHPDNIGEGADSQHLVGSHIQVGFQINLAVLLTTIHNTEK